MDPDNLFQLLVGQAQQAPEQSNVLQAAQPAPMPVQAPPPPAPVAVAEPHKRRSLLDTIGRISDVLAKVGGADALYQPTLDAREDRTLALGDHSRKVDSETIKLATDKFELGDKHNTRLGQVARGLKAIQAGGGDINQAWPVLAQRMDLDPATVDSVGKAIATDPTALDGLIAATTDPKLQQSKYSGSVVYAKGPDGKIVAFQPSLNDDGGRSILPDGYSAIEPSKVVDLGGSAAVVGNSGQSKVILPKTVRPDTLVTASTSRANNRDNNQTALTIAGMPARATQAPGKGGAAGDAANVSALLDNIQSGFADLHGMKALPGEGSGVGQIEGIIGRSALGQKFGEQLGTPPAQKRLEIMKNVSALQQAMLKSLPASATRTKFEQEMLARGLPDPSKMDYRTANTVIQQLRDSFARAVAASQKSTPAAAAPKNVKPAGGWGTATVVHGG
jgi:hypothetical protein